jgi:hypothetical protein
MNASISILKVPRSNPIYNQSYHANSGTKRYKRPLSLDIIPFIHPTLTALLETIAYTLSC